MAAGELKLTGLDEVMSALRQLPEGAGVREIMADALKQGANVVRQQAATNLRSSGAFDTGRLANELKVRRVSDQTPDEVVVTLRPSTTVTMAVRYGKGAPKKVRPSKYAHFIEYGTEHSRAKPFMRPAVDTKGQEAVNVISRVTREGVGAAARRLGLKVE